MDIINCILGTVVCYILFKIINNNYNISSFNLISYEEELPDSDFIDILNIDSLSESDIMDTTESDIENN
jgi:hypothetical protein